MLDLDWKEKSKPITELRLHLLTLFCKHQDKEIDYREKLKQSRLLLFTWLSYSSLLFGLVSSFAPASMTAGANRSANPCLDGLKILYVTIAEVSLISAAALTPANVSAKNRTKPPVEGSCRTSERYVFHGSAWRHANVK